MTVEKDQRADHLILFDGFCNLCSSLVKFVIEHDTHAHYKFAPLQSETAKKFLRDRAIVAEDIDTFILIEGERTYFKSDAALEIAVGLGNPWKLAVVLKILPRQVRDWIYSLIARNRYRLFGRRKSCMIPSDNIRMRFLD